MGIRAGTHAATMTSKQHNGGVCSVQSNPFLEHMLVSGSYDEHIFLWDERSMARPISQIEVGGGVWRLKWHFKRPHVLLAACMRGHVQILSTQRESMAALNQLSAHRLIANFNYTAHESEALSYGADWCQLQSGAGGLVGSCSFYDSSLHLWRWGKTPDLRGQ